MDKLYWDLFYAEDQEDFCEDQEDFCPHCWKEYEDWSDVGCEFCGVRMRDNLFATADSETESKDYTQRPKELRNCDDYDYTLGTKSSRNALGLGARDSRSMCDCKCAVLLQTGGRDPTEHKSDARWCGVASVSISYLIMQVVEEIVMDYCRIYGIVKAHIVHPQFEKKSVQ